MEYPTEHEQDRLSKLAQLTPDEIGWEIVDLLRTATVLCRSALNSWLHDGAPGDPIHVPEVQLYNASAAALAEALRVRFSGTPLGPPCGADHEGATWLIATHLASPS
jgi:hypothetical protein